MKSKTQNIASNTKNLVDNLLVQSITVTNVPDLNLTGLPQDVKLTYNQKFEWKCITHLNIKPFKNKLTQNSACVPQEYKFVDYSTREFDYTIYQGGAIF